ncbi:hypothetical protein [Mesorhizobium sp. M8A.F.Ca.ET.021.01.1.1]|uniref:hypothetical protein n=1 Tax=Mesorhizobium sp. M8A.F.Ca.ET.021.01.1.1 TaxID=2496757 RepID=UPI000FCCE042|nr:hypothetical protein [Mesorhizobium sp. M8A.F.Ca.ET.021.01.1.1]RUW56862.1 hypothetical protein EOA36_02150 [Mesorhizobium sp. M8A.F.Ca.ET.021.01.1.1]
MINWREAKRIIDSGEADAYDLLTENMPGIERKFKKVDKALVDLLAEIQTVFPDATYYTASGGFHLMLGPSHDDNERGMQELVALAGRAQIGDGDF